MLLEQTTGVLTGMCRPLLRRMCAKEHCSHSALSVNAAHAHGDLFASLCFKMFGSDVFIMLQLFSVRDL